MIKAWILDSDRVVARLGSQPEVIKGALKESIGRLTLALLVKAKEKLSDQVLHVRTGRLRRSVTSRLDESGNTVTGVVGTNVSYAARHEYGFTGTENVKQHLRMCKQAFGRPLKNPHEITVKAFSRHVNYPAHSFLRSALQELQPEVKREIESAMNRAMKSF